MGKISSARNWSDLGLIEREFEREAPADELRAALARRDRQAARRLVHAWIQCSERQFRSEQAVLRRQGFPRLHEHARHHESALLLFERLDACLAQGEVAGATAAYDDLCAFLNGVTRRHQAEYAAFLAKHKPVGANTCLR